MAINLNAIFDDLHKESKELHDKTYTIENILEQEYWLQITPESINAFYPFTETPLDKLQEIDITAHSEIIITDWKANQYVTFRYENNDIKKVVGFVQSYLDKVLKYNKDSDKWKQIVESTEKDIPIVSEWAITAWDWNSKKYIWIKKPILTINGEEFSYKTRQEYIDKMSSYNLSDENFLSCIAEFKDSIERNPEILPKNTFSKIGIYSIIAGLSIVAILFIVISHNVKPDELREIIPANCLESTFFWILLAAGTIYSIFSGGFTDYTPVIKSGGKTSVSYDMTDQVGAGLMTFLSPVFSGAAIALIPYYVLYWLIGVISKANAFILSVIIICVFALVIWRFLKSRPKFSRKKEVIWIIVWGVITFIILRLTLGFIFL